MRRFVLDSRAVGPPRRRRGAAVAGTQRNKTNPMKTGLARFAAAALCGCAFLSSCSNDPGAGSGSKTIGISIPAADHGWTGGVVYWAGEAKKAIESANPGVKVFISAAKDSADQVSGIENLIVRGVDAIVVLPNEPAPLTPVCKRAASAGIPLVVVDRGLAEPVQTLEVVGDNPGFGRVSAEQIVKVLDGKGKVAIMQGVLCQVNTDRVDAFRKVMEGYQDIEIVEDGVSDWSPEKGMRLMENYLQKHPQLDAVWAGDDDVLLGAKKAYEESGRTDLKILLGGGGSKAVVKMILDGDKLVSQTVTYPPKMIYEAALAAVKILGGEKPAEAKVVVPAAIVDASNAAENYFPDSAY